MSLTSVLNIGRSALSASQVAIQVAGNNMANATTPGYSRQVVSLAPQRGGGTTQGASIGLGVQVRDVRRQVDDALTGRLWTSTADQAAAGTQHQILSQIESILGELGDNDLSSELSSFFKTWSEASNGSASAAAVVNQGAKLSSFVKSLRSDLSQQRTLLDEQLSEVVRSANEMLTRVAELNGAIYDAEGGGSTANVLRDQRDQVITELSALLEVSVVDRGQQGVDVLVGSTPVVLGSSSRGLEIRRENENGEVRTRILVSQSQTQIDVSSGQIGALADGRTGSLDSAISALDDVASRLIFEVNKLHSTGRNLRGFSSLSGSRTVRVADRNVPLNDPTNETFGGLPFGATTGGFVVQVRNTATGASQSRRIAVDLDGRTAAGLPGTADDTSAEDIRAALNGVSGVRASFDAEGKLVVTADEGLEMSFSEDSSGVLAVLGMNAYFTGTNGADIAVRSDLESNPALLARGRDTEAGFVENGTSLAITGLQSLRIAALSDRSISEAWRDAAQSVGNQTATAKSRSEAATVVTESLTAQRASVSGVSLDEEAVNLINYQRQYQGAARLIALADELTQTLLNLV
ncbi:MAG: flagellar hook-associated protein FlgK [Phycisphaerales bacterium]